MRSIYPVPTVANSFLNSSSQLLNLQAEWLEGIETKSRLDPALSPINCHLPQSLMLLSWLKNYRTTVFKKESLFKKFQELLWRFCVDWNYPEWLDGVYKFHNVVRKDVTAGVALRKIAFDTSQCGLQNAVFRPHQVAWPIGIQTHRAIRELASEIQLGH